MTGLVFPGESAPDATPDVPDRIPLDKIPLDKIPLDEIARGEIPGDEIARGEIPGGEIPGGEIPGGEIPQDEIPRGETPGVIPPDGPTEIEVSGVRDFAALEARWRDLEARSDPSFFQSWTWTGCLVTERFPDPVLVEARENGRTVALALFNRRGRTLYLGESGDPALDCVFIEFNGVLAQSGREDGLTVACLEAARSWSGSRLFGHWPGRWPPLAGLCRGRLVLNGVNSATVVSAEEIGSVRRDRSLAAPFVDLANCGCSLEDRSANTRQQLRRSDRAYAACGALTIERADTVARAHEFLAGLEALHQVSWVAREQPGAFARPFFRRFHKGLIARGLPRGEVDLFRVAAGRRTIGFLYNFRYRGHSLAYQSGFDYADAGRHGKPGLTCHYQAIRFAAQWGALRYDFLAGDDRYKRSLSDRAESLHWIEVANRYSPRFLGRSVRDLLAGRHPWLPLAPLGSPGSQTPSAMTGSRLQIGIPADRHSQFD